MKRVLMDAAEDLTRIALVEDGSLIELYYESKRDESLVGNIYIGRVEQVVPNLQACFVEIGAPRRGFLYYGEERATSDVGKNQHKPRVGDTVLVQVDKDAVGQKGVTLTREVSLAGKFMVLLPFEAGEIRISRKITSEGERGRVREILSKHLPADCGVIVRTNGQGRGADEFQKELEQLLEKREQLGQAEYRKPPCLFLQEASPVLKGVRDFYQTGLKELVVNQRDAYEQLLESGDFQGDGTPELVLYEKNMPIFEEYFVESQCRKALEKRAWLKGGGYLVIEETEACVVIDVNSAKAAGRGDIEKAVRKTNLEAAVEVARQLRLRNLSGIIIVDFIDMPKEEDKALVTKALEDAVKKDRIKTVVVGMTQLGLMQITRKKTRPSLLRQMTTNCRSCEGSGRLPSLEWTVVKMRREIETILANTIYNHVRVEANERLLFAFAGGEEKPFLIELEKRFGGSVLCVPNEELGFSQFQLEKEKKTNN